MLWERGSRNQGHYSVSSIWNAGLQHIFNLAEQLSPMNAKRVSLGFDLRVNPDFQRDNPSQDNQHLVPGLRSPICADPAVWVEPEEIESLTEGILPNFANPLHLAKSIDLLIDACRERGIRTFGLWPVCLTSFEANLVALEGRFGPGYFDNSLEEQVLLSDGWHLEGFDVVDLGGLTSGLKGCGYVEPKWSQFRDYFGDDLNPFGLFKEHSTASQFAEARGLEIREHAPFVVAGILTRKPIE
jgi:hypothetical protein